MAIQWYPGHMHKAQKEIRALLPSVDVFIEVLDARIPYSSENPLLAEILNDKPCIKILHKSDLADNELTQQWINYLSSKGHTTLSTCSSDNKRIKTLPQLCHEIAPSPAGRLRATHALIVGIPNVGKSTVINILAGRAVAKTGNEPAITRAQQKIDIGHGVVLFDTPGVLWPNLEHPSTGLRLATLGSVRETAMDYTEVALFAATFMLKTYPDRMRQRYDTAAQLALDQMQADANHASNRDYLEPEVAFLQEFGRNSGCLERGGQIDFDRAARLFIHDLREGTLGSITLETPATMQIEQQELQVIREKKALRKKERSKKSKKR